MPLSALNRITSNIQDLILEAGVLATPSTTDNSCYLPLGIEAIPGPKPGLPDSIEVTHGFDSETPIAREFPNLPLDQKGS